MGNTRSITIVGGGLAGLSLGIGLRQRGIPVTVWEAGHYPRHRVCGEFISGRGQQSLARLGLQERLLHSGAVPAHTAVFIFAKAASPPRRLPTPAWCISRFTLDALLAAIFQEQGGQLLEHQRWDGEEFGEGIVRASGRRPRPVEGGWRWFGMKVHARNVPLAADLEMHAVPNGYVGLCRLKDGMVNMCGIFRGAGGSGRVSPTKLEFLQNLAGRGAVIHESSFCSVAGLALRPRGALRQAECCVGDALTMIPPVTGNGMSMAFEAAELALEPLVAYGRGELTWTRAQHLVASACDRAFARRLAWAKWLHWMMFSPLFQGRFGWLALHSNVVWNLMFARTR